MGRGKTTTKFIENEKKRNLCYRQKKRTLIKKARELSILCEVPTCVIVFPFVEGDKKPVQPEVFAYKGGEQGQEIEPGGSNSDDQATNPESAREIINRYLACPSKDVKNKKVLEGVNEENNLTRVDRDLYNNVRYENTNLSEFSNDQLIEFLGKLDHKLDYVKSKIAVIKGVSDNNHGFDGDQKMDQLFADNNQFQPSDFDQVVPIEAEYGGVYCMDIMGPTSNFYDDKGLGFADNNPLQCLPMMDHSIYCGDQGSGFVDNFPPQMMGPSYYNQGPGFADNFPLQMMGPGYCNQGSGFADNFPPQVMVPSYCNQGSGFADNFPPQCFPMMGGPMYCDQLPGFADNMSALQSCNYDLSYGF